MTAAADIQQLGQSLWLDNITRELLDSGTLSRYMETLYVTGLTSNPSIFDNAIGSGEHYDQDIRRLGATGLSDEAIFQTLALDDLRRAAALFRPVFDSSQRQDGWVSMEISPELARDSEASVAAAREVYEEAACANLYVKIPGTPESLPAIETALRAGIPVNITLLFSPAQYQAALEACLRGLEQRLNDGLAPDVSAVTSVFISRWDVAVQDKVPTDWHNSLGIAVARDCLDIQKKLLSSARWQKLAAAGARPLRLLWASTGTKDPAAPPTLYVHQLASPHTINTIPEKTLLALAEETRLDARLEDRKPTLDDFHELGLDIEAMGTSLQEAGAEAFVNSWRQLMAKIAQKRKAA